MNRNFISKLPPRFVQNTVDLCGEAGKMWLNDLPRIVEELSEKWSFKPEKPFRNLSYNFVAPCICENGENAVLKIALPLNNPEIFNEAAFLELADGNGTVKLLNLDETNRAILLEKATPGANLKEVCRTDVGKAVEITIKAMRKILKKPPQDHSFWLLDEWFDNFFYKSENTEFPERFIWKARGIYEELSVLSKEKFLIHGDLHHENILSAEREPFLVIDPKGIVGEIGFEISTFLNNHAFWLSDDLNLREKIIEAVFQFSEAFEIEPINLYKWAFAQMVLSIWWTFEDGGQNWHEEIWRTEIWEELYSD